MIGEENVGIEQVGREEQGRLHERSNYCTFYP